MRIVIAGAGFAGIEAAKKLAGQKNKDMEIILIDKNSYTTMLPSLPDVAGGKIDGEYIIDEIENLVPSSVKFKQGTIKSINFDKKEVYFENETLRYDYLLFAPGSKTNYYGFNENLDKIYTLENFDDAKKINNAFKKKLAENNDFNVVVSGAGFTGIELACGLYRLAEGLGKKPKITLIEKAPRIVPAISDNMVNVIEKEISYLGLEIVKNDFVTGFSNGTVTLNSGKTFENAFFCWCSGVMTSIPVEGNFEKLFDNRIVVNDFLQIPNYPEIFVAGDSAAFKHKNSYLRRAVNYASMMGKHSAKNIIRNINNDPLKPFSPIDMGWVIPVNLTSIGVAMGWEIKGRLGLLMHYIICGVKNYNLKNFFKFFIIAFKFATERYKK